MDSVIIAHAHNPCYVADAGKLRRKDSGCIRFFHTHLIPLFLMMNHCHGYFPICLSGAILAIAKGLIILSIAISQCVTSKIRTRTLL